MVQPTRIVCCAQEAFTLARIAASAPPARIHFEDIRIHPLRLSGAGRRQHNISLAKPFMVQIIRQGVGAASARRHPDKATICVKGFGPDRLLTPEKRGEMPWRQLRAQKWGMRKSSALSGSG